MFSQLFGRYLVDKEIISNADYRNAIKEQLAVRVKLGTIAIADGLLTEEQVESINKKQMQQDKRFGDIAIEDGFLTAEQIDALLKKQGNPYMQFVQVLMESNLLSAGVLDKTLSAFQKENGFSDTDMIALKNDDIDALVPIFAFSSKPHVTDLASLVVKNINRFITRDFYIGKMHHEKKLDYRYLAGQETTGGDSICLAITANGDSKAFTMVASGFSGQAQEEVSDDTFDAVCEFININNGLLASELSRKSVSLDMKPVFAYKEQFVQGEFYVLPIFLEEQELRLVIAVNNEATMGDTPYTYHSKFQTIYDAKAGSKGTVMLVDDSKMSRNMLKAILEEEGYSIVGEADNGEDALTVFKQCRPDLVTLDITMPKMDGIEGLKRLMEIDPMAKVIMITAAGQQAKLIEALKAGAKRFITKPFEKEEIILNINEVMNE